MSEPSVPSPPSQREPQKSAPAGQAAAARRRWSADTVEKRYEVETAVRPALRTGGRPEAILERAPRAVFVAHGMGQQRPLETLDSVAEGLLREDEEQHRQWSEKRRSAPPGAPAPKRPEERWRAGQVQVGEERLERLELKLRSWDPPNEREVHVYEGYWAPLTEGRVTLRDVIVFLFDAGLSGMARVGREFQRWLFGDRRSFEIPVRTTIYLVVAMMVVLSLIAINAVVALGGASLARLPRLGLEPGLFLDLTTLFGFAVLVIALLGGCLLLARLRFVRRRLPLRRVLGGLSRLLFYGSLLALMVTGVAIPLLFYRHANLGGGGPEGDQPVSLLARGLGIATEQVRQLDLVLAWVFLAFLAAFALVVVVLWLLRLVLSLRRDLAEDRSSSLVVFLLFLLMVGILGVEIWKLLGGRTPGSGWGSALLSLPWVLVVLVTLVVRKFLIEYLGDVAAYVSAHKLDRFDELRQQIKDRVYKAAQAVYRLGDSEEVVVVGHSLGSVVVYDTLNRLLVDDELAGAAGGADAGRAPSLERLDVADRTKLLLTFGSPLDKFAYLFSLQGKETTEARDALVAAQQPLIQTYAARRFDWCNVYAPADIISGALKFYDWKGAAGFRPVDNVKDPDATTLLLAHTEYWVNRTLFEILYRHLV